MEARALRNLQRDSLEHLVLEILESGGGIHSTVRATRSASEEALSAFKQRLTQMIHKGITTVEVKGGYGLSTESERESID